MIPNAGNDNPSATKNPAKDAAARIGIGAPKLNAGPSGCVECNHKNYPICMCPKGESAGGGSEEKGPSKAGSSKGSSPQKTSSPRPSFSLKKYEEDEKKENTGEESSKKNAPKLERKNDSSSSLEQIEKKISELVAKFGFMKDTSKPQGPEGPKPTPADLNELNELMVKAAKMRRR